MAELEIQSRGNPRQQQALARTVRADEEERLLRRQGRQHDGLDGREAVQPETGKNGPACMLSASFRRCCGDCMFLRH